MQRGPIEIDRLEKAGLIGNADAVVGGVVISMFAAALAGSDETRRRLQLKTLLFGMGETFRTLLQRKTKAPDSSGS